MGGNADTFFRRHPHANCLMRDADKVTDAACGRKMKDSLAARATQATKDFSHLLMEEQAAYHNVCECSRKGARVHCTALRLENEAEHIYSAGTSQQENPCYEQ